MIAKIMRRSGDKPDDRRCTPREDPEVIEYAGHGCLTQMHVVRFPGSTTRIKPRISTSAAPAWQRRQAGYEHAKEILDLAPWNAPMEKLAVVLHETAPPHAARIY